jgi:hypothetical protein
VVTGQRPMPGSGCPPIIHDRAGGAGGLTAILNDDGRTRQASRSYQHQSVTSPSQLATPSQSARSLDLIWIGIAVAAAILFWPTRWRVSAILAAILFGLILGVDHVGVRMAAWGDELDSFPSGHLTRAAVVIASLTLVAFRSRWRTALVVAGCLLLVALTVSRIYLGAHYPSDVLAGALVGIGVAAGVSLVPMMDPLATEYGRVREQNAIGRPIPDARRLDPGNPTSLPPRRTRDGGWLPTRRLGRGDKPPRRRNGEQPQQFRHGLRTLQRRRRARALRWATTPGAHRRP